MIIEPNYQIIKHNPEEAEIRCVFAQDYPYFSGHFTTVGILPGVVQLGLVYQFIEKLWELDLSLATVRQVKYQQLVMKETSIVLKLSYQLSKQRINFSYLSDTDDSVISSGVILL